MNDSLYMTFIACLPRKHVARGMGALAGWTGAGPVQTQLVRWFANRYRLNLDEAELPLSAYPNLSSLFTRRLKPGVRPLDPDPLAIVSPVDGVMSEYGLIVGDRCTQIKGRTYSVDELLGGTERGRLYHGGQFLTIYLSPRHYHRIHSPVAGEVVRYQHLPGHLYPVNAPSVRSIDRLFAINERLTSFVRLPRPGSPEVAVVKVGAIGVGRIRLTYADLVTNRPGQTRHEEALEPPIPIDRGDELGVFELGSTVVLVFPPGLATLEALPVGTEVRLGQRIGTLRSY